MAGAMLCMTTTASTMRALGGGFSRQLEYDCSWQRDVKLLLLVAVMTVALPTATAAATQPAFVLAHPCPSLHGHVHHPAKLSDGRSADVPSSTPAHSHRRRLLSMDPIAAKWPWPRVSRRRPSDGSESIRCKSDSMGSEGWRESILGGDFVLRQGSLDDLQGLTDLSVEAFTPQTVMAGMFNSLQSILSLPTDRSNVEKGLMQRLSRDGEESGADMGARSGADRAGEGVGTAGLQGAQGDRLAMEQGDGEDEERDRHKQYMLVVAEDTGDGSIAGMVELGILPCPIPVDRCVI